MLCIYQIRMYSFQKACKDFFFSLRKKMREKKKATPCVHKQHSPAAPGRCPQDACQLRWQSLAVSNKLRLHIETLSIPIYPQIL
jgi:hypothetical protein